MLHSRREIVAGLGAAAVVPDTPRDFGGLAGQSYLRLGHNGPVAARLDTSVDYLLIYYGAAWCGPCRIFLPTLKAAYPSLAGGRHRTEVVYVGDDNSHAATLDYASQTGMPWLIAPHAMARRSRFLSRLRGRSLPGMVLLNRNGGIETTSWARPDDSRPYQALERILAKVR